jgi:RNA polymerase sigma-70 factor, ECF subfamily
MDLAPDGDSLALPLLAIRPEVKWMFPSSPVSADVDFDQLFSSLGKSLFARALGLERTVEDAEDLVQDTIERALRNLHQFHPGTNIRMWLFRIMYHLFVDRRRRRQHERRNEAVQAAELAAPEPDALEPWEQIDHDRLTASVADLEPHFREVIALHLVSRTYREIAATLGIPTGTVGTRLLRARHKLRDILEPLAAAG